MSYFKNIKKDIYTRTVVNQLYLNNKININNFVEYLTNVPFDAFITYSFNYYLTKEGWAYWLNVNKEWNKYFKIWKSQL